MEIKAGGDARVSADEIGGDKIEGEPRRFKLLSLENVDKVTLALVGAFGIVGLEFVGIVIWGIAKEVPPEMWRCFEFTLTLLGGLATGIAGARKLES